MYFLKKLKKKKTKMNNIFKISLYMVILFVSIPSICFAQNLSGLDLTVSPSVLDISAQPGDVIKQKFRIRNNSEKSVLLHIFVDKLQSSSNGEISPVKALPNDNSLSWITFENASISALPKEWVEIPLTITVPKEAAFGYYYAIHVGSVEPKKQTAKSGTTLLGEVVIPLLLNVISPNAKADVRLLNFSSATFINEYLPVHFSITMQNMGNVHLRPKGNVFIRTGISDDETAILDINENNGVILPNTKRTFLSQWNDGFAVEEPIQEDGVSKMDKYGKTMTHVVLNWDKLTHFRIGKYTATAIVVYDNGTRDVPLQATTTFWVIPWKFMIGFISILIIVVLLIRLLLRWYIANELKKFQKKNI